MVAVPQSGSSSLRSSVIDALGRWARDQSSLITLLVEFDDSGQWAYDGAWSCAHWVAERADLELATVREWLRIGHALSKLDEVARRFAAKTLSYSKVRALVRIATRENQHELCAIAKDVPAARFPVALAAWLERTETPEDHERRHRAATSLSWRVEPDGMIASSFRLPPEWFGKLRAAIEAKMLHRYANTLGGENDAAAAISPQSVKKWPSIRQQRADALIALVTGGGASIATEVIIHVRGDGCTLDDGTPIAASVVERLVPEAFVRVLIHDAERRPINASGKHRHPTARQKRVVRERDRRCVDCGSTDLLQYDHSPDFTTSQQTVVEELKIRCAPCHHKKHNAKPEPPPS
jgi:hypothetical protein